MTYQKLVFTYLYPRIDANVSKGLNHLLKSPFCIHPKTGNFIYALYNIICFYLGKVCVPFDPLQVDSFDVKRVPTLNMVIGDISKSGSTGVKGSDQSTTNIPCLEPSIAVFKKFIEKIRIDNAKNSNAASGASNGKRK